MICPKTKKDCQFNCASAYGGYAGDDCHIVAEEHLKFDRIVTAFFYLLFGMIISGACVIFFK
jgi:hypothetical protein